MNHDPLKGYVREHRADFDGEMPPPGLWDRIADALPPGVEEDLDPLESFIAKHRDDFDDATPPPQTELRSVGSRRKLFGYLLAVAATVLLLFVAYDSGNRAGYQARQEEQIAGQLDAVDPGLAEAERFYQQRIASEFTKVSQFNDDPQLRQDLEQIDEATAELRAQLLTVPVSQRHVLVNQLIATYRTKLDILLRIRQHFPNPTAPAGAPVRPGNSSNHES